MSYLKRKLRALFYRMLAAGSVPVKRSIWYKRLFVDSMHERYPDNVWYREHDERNFDIVNLGSSGGKWAFDWQSVGVKGMNWANQPQTLIDDFRLLKNFHSILKRGGTVIITIMPFSSLNKSTGVMDTLKYLPTLYWDVVQGMPYVKEARRLQECPVLFGKPAIKAGLRYLLHRERIDADWRETIENNPMSLEQLEEDAGRWMQGWARQFNIMDFEAPLTDDNRKGRNIRIKVMRELIDFCTERGYRPVYVIPPVTNQLAKRFTPRFRELYIYDFLKEVDRDIRLLDYLNEDELSDQSLYFNSFFLNRRGREIFTRKVMGELSE